MNSEAQDLLDRALKLPPEARAALAGSLISSLDDAPDPRGSQRASGPKRPAYDRLP